MVGKTKDEKAGVAIEEFVGLKPKMYSGFSPPSPTFWQNNKIFLAKDFNLILSSYLCSFEQKKLFFPVMTA